MINDSNGISCYDLKFLKYIAGMKKGHDKCIA